MTQEPAMTSDAHAAVLITDDRRRIYTHLQAGRRAYVQESDRVVDLETAADLGTHIAALELIYAGLAIWCQGCPWVVESTNA
jgi:hypothetical protein